MVSSGPSAQRFFEVGAVGVVLGVVLALMSTSAYILNPGVLPLLLGLLAVASGFLGAGLMTSGWALAGTRRER